MAIAEAVIVVGLVLVVANVVVVVAAVVEAGKIVTVGAGFIVVADFVVCGCWTVAVTVMESSDVDWPAVIVVVVGKTVIVVVGSVGNVGTAMFVVAVGVSADVAVIIATVANVW